MGGVRGVVPVMVCGVFGVFVVVFVVVVCVCVFVVFVRTSHALLYSLPLSEKNECPPGPAGVRPLT